MRRHVLVTTLLTGLILYGGLFPFRGWVTGSAIAFLSEKSPHSGFEDLIVNIVVFIPLGMFATLALNHQYRLGRSVALAVVHGFFLSFVIEAFQAFLPTRYSSFTDLMMNTLGTFTGSLLAVGMRSPRMRTFHEAWFEPPSFVSLAYIAYGAWAVVQILPTSLIFDPADGLSRLRELVVGAALHRPFNLGAALMSTLAFVTMSQLLNALGREGVSMGGRVLPMLWIPVLVGMVTLEHDQAIATLIGALTGSVLFASPSPRMRALLATGAVFAYLVLGETLPGDNGSYRVFNWIPFALHLRSPLLGIVDLISWIWPAVTLAVCASLLTTATNPIWLWAAGMIATLCVLLLEWIQASLPGRCGDVTPALVMGFAYSLSLLYARFAHLRRATARRRTD